MFLLKKGEGLGASLREPPEKQLSDLNEQRIVVMITGIASICLALICLLCTLQLTAQSNPRLTGIPDDLLITLKKQEGWGGAYYETTITATGDYSVQVRGGLPVRPMPGILTVNGKSVKPIKYLKPKLSNQKLQQLLAEFEKIQFFEFGKGFPPEDEKEHRSVSDAATEVISIRVHGKTKEVSNYLGDSLKRTRILRDLAEKIRGAGIWNFENDEIPENFQVWYRNTGEDRIVRNFKIGSNGKIVESSSTIDFFEKQKGNYVPHVTKPKTVGKLSKPQLKQLIDEFEKVGFSTFRYSTLSKYDGCSNAPPPTGEKRIHISVQINRVDQMYASLYENCNPNPETNAAKFEHMANEIKRLLKTVKNIKMN